MTAKTRRIVRARRLERKRLGIELPRTESLAIEDPLLTGDRTIGVSKGAALIIGTAIAHAVAIAAVIGGIRLIHSLGWDKSDRERIEVAVVEQRVEAPPPPVAPPEPPPPEKPIDPPPKPPPKKPKPPPPPPPDPVDLPPDEPPPPDAPPPEAVVGLNADSTVKDGAGPKFATGNTRMGQTDETAKDPNDISQLPKTLVKPEPYIIPPKRKRKMIDPEYPRKYRAMQIEDSVTVKVVVSSDGDVSEVTIVTPSKYEEFNFAARKAALKDRYEPATRNGVAVAYALTVKYTFRLTD